MPKFDEDIESLIQRVTPMLDEVDLETHVSLTIDMDDPQGQNAKNRPEIVQKLGALCDQRKINPREHNRLAFHFLERESK